MATIRFYIHPDRDSIYEEHEVSFCPWPAGGGEDRPFYYLKLLQSQPTSDYGWQKYYWYAPGQESYPTNFFCWCGGDGNVCNNTCDVSLWITQSEDLYDALVAESADRFAAGTWRIALYLQGLGAIQDTTYRMTFYVYRLRGGDQTELFHWTTENFINWDDPALFDSPSQQAFSVNQSDRLVIKAYIEKVDGDDSIKVEMGKQNGSEFFCYIEFPADETPLPGWLDTGNLLACVDAPVRLNTDHTMYSETGHEPKYVLDNDPNTYWKPDSIVDRTIYFDLGSNVQVDAFAFWIHNHNAGLGATKAWELSYSTDDSSYTTFESKLFSDSRNAGVPLIAFKFENPVSARYWKLELIDFDDTPEGPVAEIGCVWFMRDYSLPYDNQYPEDIGLKWGNNSLVARSGSGYQSRAHTGHVRSMGKQYVFVQSADSELLRNAYKASYGNLLPIAFKPDYDSVDWLLCRFTSKHNLNETWSETYRPKMDVREVGFKRIVYMTHTLPTLSTTVGHWKFTSSLADSSNNDHTLAAVDIPGGAVYDYGICDHNKTCIVFDDDGLLNLDAVDAALLDMGTSDFSMELILATATVSETIYLLHKFGDSPSPPPSPEPSPSPLEAGYYIALTTAGKLNVCVGDGSNEVIGTDYGTDLDDGEFHYIAVTVDRTNDLLKVYVDGVHVGSNLDISAVTGDISNSIEPFQLGRENISAAAKQIIGVFDEVCVSKQLLILTLIQSRWAGYAHDGSWRL